MGISQMVSEERGLVVPKRRDPNRLAEAPAVARETVPGPEVPGKAVRRRFTAEYKLRILREAEQCGPGGIAALRRRRACIPRI